MIENESRGIYWVGQKVCSGFYIRGNEKMQMKLLANSIRLLEAWILNEHNITFVLAKDCSKLPSISKVIV